MSQLWTIIFVAVLAIAFAVAHQQDCAQARRRERWSAPDERKDRA